MVRTFAFLLVLIMPTMGCSGQSGDNNVNAKFDETIKTYLKFTVPTISCDSLSAEYEKFLVLDARETPEYEVSHLPDAQHVGYQEFDIDSVQSVEKDTPIVVYCSIGYRSEKIGETLKEEGFRHVYNLYGSIFEWVNQGNLVVDSTGNTTNKVHTYNKKWSKWVTRDNIEKVW